MMVSTGKPAATAAMVSNSSSSAVPIQHSSQQPAGSAVRPGALLGPPGALPADVLTLVSLSLDGDQLQPEVLPPPLAAAAAARQLSRTAPEWDGPSAPAAQAAMAQPAAYGRLGNGSNSNSNSNSGSAQSLLLPADAAGPVALATASLFAEGGSLQLSEPVRQLLADSIALNSTASIRLVPLDESGDAEIDDNITIGAAACVSEPGGSRQLDMSGNRTECALLEFGGRLSGYLLPGAGSQQQQAAVLQVMDGVLGGHSPLRWLLWRPLDRVWWSWWWPAVVLMDDEGA